MSGAVFSAILDPVSGILHCSDVRIVSANADTTLSMPDTFCTATQCSDTFYSVQLYIVVILSPVCIFTV